MSEACGQISSQVSVDAGGDVGVLNNGKAYDGYVLGQTWLSGSNRIRLTFATANDGSVYGTVIFGDDPLLAPPTNPKVGYPPGWTGDGQSGLMGPIEHFPFTMLNGQQQGSRVTFALDLQEIWKSWCELQTVYGESCLPAGATNLCPGADAGSGSCCLFPPDGGAVPMDCEYMKLCSWGGPCTCASSGCTVDLTTNNVSFDLELSGNALDGSIGTGAATIHATIASP